MNPWTAALPAALAGALMFQPPTVSPTIEETYTLTGEDVAIWNLAGHVTVRPASGRSVLVDLQQGGRNANELTVAQGRLEGRETLRVIYPSTRVVYEDAAGNTSLDVAEDGTFGEWATDDDHRVRIRDSGEGLHAWADMTVSVPSGQRIAIFLGTGRIEAANIDGEIRLDGASAAISTDGLRGDVLLDSGSGEITVRRGRGDFVVDTGSGEVHVEDVVGDRLAIDTGSGEVDVRDVSAATISIDTGSGAVRAANIRSSDIVIDTGSGGVDLALLTDINRLVVDTGSGGVRIDAPDNLGARLFLETGSGGIDVDLPLTVERMERDELVGRIGDGEGTIEIDTGSGGIRIF